MATTCKLIAKTVLSASTANIEFTSIPGTYTDLLLNISSRSDRALSIDALWIRFNNDSGGNYQLRYIYGNGASAVSGSGSSQTQIYCGYAAGSTSTSNTFASAEVYIPNYAGSTNKSVSLTQAHETNASTAYLWASAHLWSSTSAITSIKIYPDVGQLVSGSSFYLYGITKA